MKKLSTSSKNPLSFFRTVGVLALVSSATQGATLTGVTIEDVSSELVSGFDRGAIRVLDGSGFDEALGTHNVTPDGNQGGGMWLNNGTFANPNDPNAPGAVITFDLGGSTALSSLTVWNYNEMLPGRADLLNRGANAVEILVASAEGGAFASLGNFNFTIAPGVDNVDFGQDIDLSGLGAAGDTRLVRFNITSSHGGDNNFVGLSEVRFDGAPVPEPTTGILALIGLAGCLRRRR
tara:strand:+ start:730 stop:1434 length:705 start_codon:yes stop_codon:yes gene_type:complete